MKLKNIGYSLICVMAAFFASCQPTPEEEIIVNKADGGLQEKIESTAALTAGNESATELTAEIEAEERWETFLQKEKVNITINAEVVTPDVESYPVLSIVPIEMDQEWADKALEVFFQGATPYAGVSTKQDIEARILILKKVQEQIKTGNYSIGFTDEDYDYLQKEINTLMNIYETAPDESELVPTDTTFEETYNGQFTLKILDVMGKVNKSSFANLGIVNNWTIKYNGIEFSNYDNNGIASSTSSAEYNDGDILNGISISCQEAQQIADKAISDMGITGVELKNVNTLNIYEVKPRMNKDISESDKQAYEFVYEKTYNGIPVTYFDSRMVTEQTEEGTDSEAYSAVLEPERLKIRVDNSGVILFNWKIPTYSDGVITENVELLDFEKIKEIFSEQVFYHYFYGSPVSLDVFIDKIVLSYFIQPVINSNDEYMAIPVWDFINEASGEYNSGRASTYLTINAIDGSVINRKHGY